MTLDGLCDPQERGGGFSEPEEEKGDIQLYYYNLKRYVCQYIRIVSSETRLVSYNLIPEPITTKCNFTKNFCKLEQSFQVIQVHKLE